MSEPIVVWASKKVAIVGEDQMVLKYDAGVWTIEVWTGRAGPTKHTLPLPPEAMDALVAEWPELRQKVDGGQP